MSCSRLKLICDFLVNIKYRRGSITFQLRPISKRNPMGRRALGLGAGRTLVGTTRISSLSRPRLSGVLLRLIQSTKQMNWEIDRFVPNVCTSSWYFVNNSKMKRLISTLVKRTELCTLKVSIILSLQVKVFELQERQNVYSSKAWLANH